MDIKSFLAQQGDRIIEEEKKGLMTSQEALDRQIDDGIQKREMAKMRQSYFSQLKEHYSSRKYKERVTLGCAQRCLANFKEDDLTRTETRCLHNCFHKYYRYLAYSNGLYSYLTADNDVKEGIDEEMMLQNMGEDEAQAAELKARTKKELDLASQREVNKLPR